MFNFQSSSISLKTRKDSRRSVSDIGLGNLKADSMQIGPTTRNILSSTVSLPPIVKTRSLTVTSSVHSPELHEHLQEPQKRPAHRQMILLTLRHVHSTRGLTFDQLSSFIQSAFDLPKSTALDLKLGKTISNMVSRGIILKIPGLGVYDATYKLPEASVSGLDLSVHGRSVQEVPTWPNGYSLPNGVNFLCRSAPNQNKNQDRKQQNQQTDRFSNSKNGHLPIKLKLDPMPYMPVSDPMICQSFGARVGLTGLVAEQRPNSPCLGQLDAAETEFDYSKGVWMPPLDNQVNKINSNESTSSTSRNPISPFDIQPQLPCVSPNPIKEPEPNQLTLGYKPQQQSLVPRILDTCTTTNNLELVNILRDTEENGDIFINHTDESHLKNLNLGDIDRIECDSQGQSPRKQRNVESLEDKLKRLSTPKTCKYSGKLEMTQRLTSRTTGTLSESLKNANILGNYCTESQQEFELNNRTCQIMNDFKRRHHKESLSTTDHDDVCVPENRMDYLMGIADIIDNYSEKPFSPSVTKSGASGKHLVTNLNTRTHRRF